MLTIFLTIILILSPLGKGYFSQAEEGILEKKIILGSVLALKGPARGLGNGMKVGINSALEDAKVNNKKFEVIFQNDSYEPVETIKSTNDVIKKGVFLFIGNVGTPTAKVSLPILAGKGIPSLGFFTGAGLLRPAPGPIANYRASYIQETSNVIKAGIRNGLKTEQVCAYVQNDAYGMAGLKGVYLALKTHNANKKTLGLINDIIEMKGTNPERNGVGPVGVYTRNTEQWKPGLDSLISWEKKNKSKCKLVVTVGAYGNIALFTRSSRKKGMMFAISAVSFTGADNFRRKLKNFKVTDGIIMTQVVPLLNSKLPIVNEARKRLGKKFGFVSLEGYISAKMMLKIMEEVQGNLTRKSFIQQVKKSKFNLGGLNIDFTANGYQGSNLVIPSLLKPEIKIIKKGKKTRKKKVYRWRKIESADWKSILSYK